MRAMSYTPRFPGRGKFHRAVLATAGAACLLLGTAVSANAWIIDFENLSEAAIPHYHQPDAGLIIDDEYTAGGQKGGIPGAGGIEATFYAYNYNAPGNKWDNSYAVRFDTNNWTGGDPDLAATFDSPYDNKVGDDYNPGHVLILHEQNYWNGYSTQQQCSSGVYCKQPDDEADRPAGLLFIEFSELVYLDSIDFFDVEGVEDGQTPNNEIHLYNEAGEILPVSFWTPKTGGDNKWAQVDFGGIGVKKVAIELNGSGAIDNIKGHLAQVPEPASAGLFAVGMVAFGALRRRRQRVEA